MSSHGLPKAPALYFRLDQEYQVAAFDLLALAGVKPHPEDSLGSTTGRAFRLAVDELRRQGVLPRYKTAHDVMLRFAYFKPNMFASLQAGLKLSIDRQAPRKAVFEQVAASEREVEEALWDSLALAPWEGYPMCPVEIIHQFTLDNQTEPISEFYRDHAYDEAAQLAFQNVFGSLPDETWLSEPVLQSVKIRTLEYRSYIDEQAAQQRSEPGPEPGTERNQSPADPRGNHHPD